MLPCPTVVLPGKDEFKTFQHCMYFSSDRAAEGLSQIFWQLLFCDSVPLTAQSSFFFFFFVFFYYFSHEISSFIFFEK